MTLTAQTKIGLTVSQAISFIGVIAVVIGFYYSLSIRLTELEAKTYELEKGRLQNAMNIETMRTENRQEHSKMLDKMDMILVNLKK